MSRKLALLIGVSEYGEGIPPLNSPLKDVEAMRRILTNPDLGGFEVTLLPNPDLVTMQRAISKLFKNKDRDDLVLFYFSGHGITNDQGQLYLTTRLSTKDDFEANSVAASFIQNQSDNCYARRQVLILDACYSGAIREGWRTKSIDINIKAQLGGEGRAVLTSSSATQVSFEQDGAELSLYTQYLVEGMETGAADNNKDSVIHIAELHDYAKSKVQAVKPNAKPDILTDKEGYKIILANAPRNPEADYRQWLEQRQWLEKYNQEEENLHYKEVLLNKWKTLGLSDEKAKEIEKEVTEPFRRRKANLNKYRQAFQRQVDTRYPFDDSQHQFLEDYREPFGLPDEDIVSVEAEILAPIKARLEEAQRQAELERRRIEEEEAQRQAELERQRIEEEAQRQAELEKQRREEEEISLGNVELKTDTWETVKIKSVEPAKSGFLGVGKQEAKISLSKHSCQGQYFTETLGQGVSLEMILIPGGTFLMGTDDEEIERLNKKYNANYFSRERPQHRVTVPQFFMAKYPIIQAQWKAIASLPKVEQDLEPDPSNFKGYQRPVECVNWFDAVEFCQRLSRETGRDYRLPSEAQWEYACRAAPLIKGGEGGSKTTPFYFGETITGELANYNATDTYADKPKGEYREQTTPVGQFPPNAFGLYDMHGNVWEWCLDDWHSNYQNAPNDGSAWLDEENFSTSQNESNDGKNEKNKPNTVLRGGSWHNPPDFCRSVYRYFDLPRVVRNLNFGFRVVCGFGRT